MSIRRIVLAAALACGGPAAAQVQPGGAADSAWVNLVTISRLRDEFAARPGEASLQGSHARPWAQLGWPVVLPEPFRSRTFVAESYVLLNVDSAGRAAGCRPLRAGAHPELDTFACTLLMRPGYFAATLIPQPQSLAGQWVMGLRWESLTAAAHRARPREGGVAAGAPLPAPRPQARAGSASGDRWARISPHEWIDTTSVSLVRENRFRFLLRRNYDTPLRRVSDGMTFDRSEEVMEADCVRGRTRLLERRSLLGPRVAETEEIHVSIQRFWKLPSPRIRDGYCPVLRQAQLRSTPVTLASVAPEPEPDATEPQARDIAGIWTGADSAGAFVRVHLTVNRAPDNGWAGYVSYRDTRTGQSICGTPLRSASGAGATLELTEVRCGGGVLRLLPTGRQMRLERSGTSEAPGGIADIVLQFSPIRPPAPIQIGRTMNGRLESGDPFASDERLYDDYTFTAPNAMSLRITMRSTEFSPFLLVSYGEPARVISRGSNDTGGGTDAQVTVDVPAGTRVRIRASAWSTGMEGAYTVLVATN